MDLAHDENHYFGTMWGLPLHGWRGEGMKAHSLIPPATFRSSFQQKFIGHGSLSDLCWRNFARTSFAFLSLRG